MNSRKFKSPFPELGYLGSQEPSSVSSVHLEEIISGRHQGGPGKTSSMSFLKTLRLCLPCTTPILANGSGSERPHQSALHGTPAFGDDGRVQGEGPLFFCGFIFNCRSKTCPFTTCPETFRKSGATDNEQMMEIYLENQM